MASIKIGTRQRRDMGDLRPLAESLDQIGLLHPVVVDSRHRLIAGARRIEAAKLLGWKTIPVRVVDLERLVKGEFAENACRKDFTLSEIAAIAKQLRPVVEDQARGRRDGTLKRGKELPDRQNLPNGTSGKSRDIVAATAGFPA